jgi:integral membrane protein (TIGR01906 family)
MLKLLKMRIAGYFLIILIPLLIILGNFQYLARNLAFYQNTYDKVGVYQSFESREVVDQATANLLGYFRGKNNLDHNFFSNQATLHLADVNNLLRLESGLFYLSLITITIISIIFILKKQHQKLASSFLISTIITFIAVVLLAIGLLSAFDPIFVGFHKLLFNNQLWLFPPTDNLIKLFPQQFFVSFANNLARNILITSAVIAFLSLFISRKTAK